MRSTLIGKMDGDRIVVLPESEYMVSSGEPCVDDIVEIGGRVYKIADGGRIDITSLYCLVADWYPPEFPLLYEDVL